MKSTVTALPLLVLGAVVAQAADLARPAYTKAPAEQVWSWTGVYGGLNAGYGINAGGLTNNTFDTGAGQPIAFSSAGTSGGGALGGGQIGYNWQSSAISLIGVEADIQGIGDTFSTTTLPVGGGTPGDTQTVSGKLTYFATVRGRIGLIARGSSLFYATGGYAVGGASLNVNDNLSNYAGSPSANAGSFTKTVSGWTAGAGLETLIAANWSAKAEYLYLDLGSIGGTIPLVANAIPFGTHSGSAEIREHVVRAGLNYHF